MNQVDRCLEAMKKGLSWKNIKENFPGGSTRYGAFSQYFEWAEHMLKDLSLRINEIDNEKNEKEKSLDILSKKNVAAEKLQNSLMRQNNRLDELVDKRQERFNELVRTMNSMNVEMKALEERGVTLETIARVVRIGFETGDELTERITTYESYNELVGQVKNLKEEIDVLENRKENSEKKLENIDIQITSTKNSLDEEKRKLWSFRESHEIVEEFLKNGYDKEILFSLIEAFKALQIAGDIQTSLTRLLDALKGVKKLDELDTKIRRKSSELKGLEERVDEISGTLKVIEENAIKKIQSLKNEGISELRDLNSEIKDSLKMASDVYRENIEKNRSIQESVLEAIRKSTESRVSKISDHFDSRVYSSITSLENDFQIFRGEIARWGEMKQEQGKHKRMMIYGTILLGILENPRKELPKVPLEVITKLLDKIASYLYLTMPEVRAKPTEIIAKQEPHLYTYYGYRLVSLLDVVYEYLAMQVYRPSK